MASSQSKEDVTHNIQAESEKHHDSEAETDDLLAELESEDPTSNPLYQKRLHELQQQAAQTRSTSLPSHSQPLLTTLSNDKDTLQFSTEHPKSVILFSHSDFPRCATMKTHIERIARAHAQTEEADEGLALGVVDAEQCPFVVERLGVRVLPCVIGFVGGVVKGRVTGFEGLVYDGDERTEKGGDVTRELEGRMVEWGLLMRRIVDGGDTSDDDGEYSNEDRNMARRRGIKASKRRDVNDDDDDWD